MAVERAAVQRCARSAQCKKRPAQEALTHPAGGRAGGTAVGAAGARRRRGRHVRHSRALGLGQVGGQQRAARGAVPDALPSLRGEQRLRRVLRRRYHDMVGEELGAGLVALGGGGDRRGAHAGGLRGVRAHRGLRDAVRARALEVARVDGVGSGSRRVGHHPLALRPWGERVAEGRVPVPGIDLKSCN